MLFEDGAELKIFKYTSRKALSKDLYKDDHTQITQVYMRNCSLKNFPSAFAVFYHVTILDARGCGLVSTKGIGGMFHLQLLNLFNNPLRDTRELHKCVNMRKLFLPHCVRTDVFMHMYQLDALFANGVELENERHVQHYKGYIWPAILARERALCLLALRWKRFSSLSRLPKDIVKIIAKNICKG